MRRLPFLLVLLTAHILGSYGIELMDEAANYELAVPFRERVLGPVHALPALIGLTLKHHLTADLALFWIGYLFPFTCVVGAYLLWTRLKNRRAPRGFDVLP